MGSTKRRLTNADVEAIEKLAVNVDAVTGVTLSSGTLKSDQFSFGIQIIGASDVWPRIINMKMLLGDFFTREEAELGRRVVVLGNHVARKLFPNDNPIGRFVKVAESEHRVVGVIDKMGDKLGFNMDDMAFLPVKDAMRLFNEDRLFGLRARAKSKVNLADAVDEIKSILRSRHNNQEDFTIVTQDAMLGTMQTILGMLTYVLGGIAAISMLVGGIGIMNIMLVSVTERTREIGIRRAVGARRIDILKQFLAEALVLSLTGGGLGLLGSVLITYVVYWSQPTFDMRAPYWIFLPAFGISLVAGVVFGVWPARKASMLDPIEALRFE
jgi:putative ABC transport system permease protein